MTFWDSLTTFLENMSEEQCLQLFKKTGALLTGHFLLTSSLHSERYFQCAKVLQYPEYAEILCSHIARHFEEKSPDLVIAPALGGLIAGHEAARALGVRFVFTERENGQMSLRRGFEIHTGEKALVVEDVITTGGSVREVREVVKQFGATPVGVGCIVDRSGGQVDFGVTFFSLLDLQIEAHPPETCALCQQGMPLVKPGSRKIDG